LDDQSLQIGPARYDVQEGSGASTLNQLLRLSTCNNDGNTVELVLCDPQSGENMRITLVRVTLEHDPESGAIFFNGVTDGNMRVNGFVRPKASPEGVIGSVTITF